MALKRLWGKAVLMVLREKKLFVIFTLIYTFLIFLTSLFLHLSGTGGIGGSAGYFAGIFLGTSLFLSLLYAWIIVSRNKRTFAVLKCIGYTNGNINAIVSGIILFTTLTGFIVVLEILFHYSALMSYLLDYGVSVDMPVVLVGLAPVIATSILFLFVQVGAIFLANRKILKVRPIIALKKVGE